MQHRINHASSNSAPSRSDFERRFRFHPHPLRSNPTHPQSERDNQGIILQSPHPRPISPHSNGSDQKRLSNISESAESIDIHTIPTFPTDADLRAEGLTFTQICSSLQYLQRPRTKNLDLQPKAFSEIRHFHGQPIYSSISDDYTHGSTISSPLISMEGTQNESTVKGMEVEKVERFREISNKREESVGKSKYSSIKMEGEEKEISKISRRDGRKRREESCVTDVLATDETCDLELKADSEPRKECTCSPRQAPDNCMRSNGAAVFSNNTEVQQARSHLALATELPRDLNIEYDYIVSPHTASSAVSKTFTNSFEERSLRLSPVSPIAGEVLSQFKHPAENFQDLIKFDDGPETKLHDRNNWPLPMSVQAITTSPLTAGFHKANSFDANANNNDQEQTNDSTDNHFHVNDGDSRHSRTGFIIQDRTDSIASIHSRNIPEKLELSRSATMMLIKAGKTPARSNTVKPSSVVRAPLSRRFSLSSGATPRCHIQKDLGCDRSVAVLTPMSEAFENLIGDHKAEFVKSHKSRPWLRWEFRGGLVGQG